VPQCTLLLITKRQRSQLLTACIRQQTDQPCPDVISDKHHVSSLSNLAGQCLPDEHGGPKTAAWAGFEPRQYILSRGLARSGKRKRRRASRRWPAEYPGRLKDSVISSLPPRSLTLRLSASRRRSVPLVPRVR